MVKVLVVEDSLFFRELLVKNLNQIPDIEVVATARDPFEARDAILEYGNTIHKSRIFQQTNKA